MAKRFIDTNLFRSPFMRGLEAPYKALWVYLCCECDHAGVWTVELDVAELRLGMKLKAEIVLQKMGGAVVSIDGGRKWYLPEFVRFQYGTLNPSNRAHGSVIERLASLGIDPNEEVQNKPLASPLQGAMDKDKEKDTELECKERARAKATIPFEPWWNLYRKGSRKLSAEQWERLSDADRQACMTATPAYLASKPDPIYRKDGERFLRHRTWEDPIVTPQPTQPNGLMSKEQAREELRKVRERLGIAPGGPIETHMIPEPIRKALAQP